MGPNVLLIVLDAARADALEPYGARQGCSPALSDLARNGVAAEAYATASWTVPSHASMFAGRLAGELGVLQAPDGPSALRARLGRLGQDSLAARLSSRGYATAMLSANVWVRPETGLASGFSEFRDIGTGALADIPMAGARGRASHALEALRARRDDGAERAVQELGELVAGRRAGKPFFCFMNLVEAHSPYMPPHPFNPLSPRERLLAAEEARRHLNLDSIWRACAGGEGPSSAAIERMRALYAGAIRYLDDRIAAMTELLDAAGVLDETLVIVTSDHGENLGEEGRVAHAFSLDQRLLRVPLIATGPGRGAFEGELVSLAELPARVATATGAELTDGAEALPPRGTAVAEFDPPVGPGDARATEAARRWGLGEQAERVLTTSLTAAVHGDHKLIREGGPGGLERLERLEPETREAVGVAEGEVPSAVVAELQAAIELADRRRSRDAGEPDTARPDESGESPEELNAELERRMRALGYL